MHSDYEKCWAGLARYAFRWHCQPSSRLHNRAVEDDAEAHLKRLILGREAFAAITNRRLDPSTWEWIFCGDFYGRCSKRVPAKIIGE